MHIMNIYPSNVNAELNVRLIMPELNLDIDIRVVKEVEFGKEEYADFENKISQKLI